VLLDEVNKDCSLSHRLLFAMQALETNVPDPGFDTDPDPRIRTAGL
jgi:hypothetical protein